MNVEPILHKETFWELIVLHSIAASIEKIESKCIGIEARMT